MNRSKNLQGKIDDVNRMRKLSQERVLFKPYYPSKIDRRILFAFGKIPAEKLAKELSVHRSYVYSIVDKYRFIFSKDELK